MKLDDIKKGSVLTFHEKHHSDRVTILSLGERVLDGAGLFVMASQKHPLRDHLWTFEAVIVQDGAGMRFQRVKPKWHPHGHGQEVVHIT